MTIIGGILLTLGVAFCLIGMLGVFRFPELYSRVHAASLTDTMGAGLILIGLVFFAGFNQVSIKLILILLFLLMTSPVAAHALVRAAWGDKIMPLLDKGHANPDPVVSHASERADQGEQV